MRADSGLERILMQKEPQCMTFLVVLKYFSLLDKRFDHCKRFKRKLAGAGQTYSVSLS